MTNSEDLMKIRIAFYELGNLASALDLLTAAGDEIQVSFTVSTSFAIVENLPLKISKEELIQNITARISELENAFKGF